MWSTRSNSNFIVLMHGIHLLHKYMMTIVWNELVQRCTNPRCWVAWATEFCILVMVPNICGSSVWNLFHITLLASRTLKLSLDFWKICEPLHWFTFGLSILQKEGFTPTVFHHQYSFYNTIQFLLYEYNLNSPDRIQISVV